MLSPTCVCVRVVRLTQICRSVNVSSALQVSQPCSGSTPKKKTSTFYQPNSPRLTRLLPFMLQYQQIKRQNLPPHQGNPVRGRARGESTALWKFHLCTVSHWYGAMMPGIYENSNRFEGGKTKREMLEIGKETTERMRRRNGESDKNATVPEDKNIRCLMKEKGESAGVNKKMDRRRREVRRRLQNRRKSLSKKQRRK